MIAAGRFSISKSRITHFPVKPISKHHDFGPDMSALNEISNLCACIILRHTYDLKLGSISRLVICQSVESPSNWPSVASFAMNPM